tara:strand:- start:6241 stop:7185 length:945 start_codon:yes stop_codon:yes gene_type:complete
MLSKLAFLKKNMRVPVIAAPMFIVSTPALVVEQCRAGIIGSFPALNARGKNGESTLEDWLIRIKAGLCLPGCPSIFAVNQIVHPTNKRLMEDMDLIVKHKVPIVITSLGARNEINDAVHSYGGFVFHDVVSNSYAKKAINKGADGLIAVASGAGGHAGNQSPFALVQEIREWFKGPLVLGGSISSGRSIAAALTMGADFAYIGSPFIATTEANAANEYKNMIVNGCAEDIVNTNVFTGINGNYLLPSIENAGLNINDLEKEGIKENLLDTSKKAPKAWSSIWGCGQGISNINEIVETKTLIHKLARDFNVYYKH